MATDPIAQATILAVDDVEQNLDVIVESLSDSYDVRVALDGEGALDAVAADPPDLILLDVMMPGMDGYQVCRRLKEDPQTARIPVIFLTARGDLDDVVTGFEVGGADYLVKPVQIPELLARVATHLSLKFAHDELDEKNADQRELLHVLCHDLANPFNSIISVLDIFGGDQEKMREYLPLLKSSAKNGVELIGLIRSLRAADEKPIELAPVPLLTAVQESVQMLESRLADKEQIVVIDVPAEVNVRAERTSLVNSVLNNALTNASKFSLNGAEIRVTTAESPKGLALEIIDSGVGIPEDLLLDLFDVSKATNRPGTGGETGTGFGMPLMQKFMRIYGGDITVQSVTGPAAKTGTTVRLEFQPGNAD